MGRGGFQSRGQVNFKSSSLPFFALDPDESATLLHNSVDRGKSQTGAFAEFFGGEKRLKDARSGFRIHPVPSIGNDEKHESAGLHWRPRPDSVFVRSHVVG